MSLHRSSERLALEDMPSQLMRCTGDMQLLYLDEDSDYCYVDRWDHETGARTRLHQGCSKTILPFWLDKLAHGAWFEPTDEHIRLVNFPYGIRAKDAGMDVKNSDENGKEA